MKTLIQLVYNICKHFPRGNLIDWKQIFQLKMMRLTLKFMNPILFIVLGDVHMVN